VSDSFFAPSKAASRKSNNRPVETNAMKRGGQLKLNTEYPMPDEEILTVKLISLIKEMLEKNYLTGTTYRDTHAKGHAAVRGEFIVDADLPQELRVGLFNQARSYPCWIRFANTSGTPRPDIKGDVRSMSIKLMGVDRRMLWQDDENEKTMDFLLMGAPKFLTPNLAQFYEMELALDKGGMRLAWFFLTHFRVTWTILTSFKACPSLLEVPYWSQTAYLFGTRAVKYHIKPLLPATSTVPRKAANNYLRQRLEEHLARADAAFEFMVQFQTDAEKMPIEDPTVPWHEALSPYRKVATIKIPSQSCGSAVQAAFCEHLSFNPWRTLPEHRPLGAINRVRKAVYPAISSFRHHRNAVPLREPVADARF
jgi:hypothetical protein